MGLGNQTIKLNHEKLNHKKLKPQKLNNQTEALWGRLQPNAT
jgi:hypothetical protein